jgi:hypothetical protein
MKHSILTVADRIAGYTRISELFAEIDQRVAKHLDRTESLYGGKRELLPPFHQRTRGKRSITLSCLINRHLHCFTSDCSCCCHDHMSPACSAPESRLTA